MRSLTLTGDTWARLGNSKHLCALLSKSPNLEVSDFLLSRNSDPDPGSQYLEVPVEFHHLTECSLPRLKKLKLLIQSGANSSIDQSRALFLKNHPSIEELNWSPIGGPWIPSDVLPNLRSLTSNRQFIMAMDDPHYGTGSSANPTLSLPSPPSQPALRP